MELSTNIDYLRAQRGTLERRDIASCAKIVKQAGFKYVDCSAVHYLMEDNWKEIAFNEKSALDKEGLIVDQTHAPFNFDDYDEQTFKLHMQRAFEITKLMGAKNIVVHASNYKPGENGFDFNAALNTVYDFYAPYVEYAKKAGIGVAIENLCGRSDRKPVLFTCYVEEQKAIIDKFNDPCVNACWDFGHGMVTYGDKHLEMLKLFEGKLACTHVHDNRRGRDLHQPPFFGEGNWEAVVKYLKESGYDGKFTFELVYGCIPDALIQKYMDFLYETGEYMLSL